MCVRPVRAAAENEERKIRHFAGLYYTKGLQPFPNTCAVPDRMLCFYLTLTLFHLHLLTPRALASKPSIMPPTPPPPSSLRPGWTPALAYRFLRHCLKAKQMPVALAP